MDLAGRIQPLLDGPLAWHRVVYEEETTSTNDLAAERVRAGEPAGVVVVAERQTAGRGRLDRAWQDHPGGSLLVSMTVPAPPTDLTLLPLVAGIAAADAIHRQGAPVKLKWPNDLLAPRPGDGRLAKCGGILTELVEGPTGGQVVVGIGIDVDWRGVDRSGDAARWISLAEVTGEGLDRVALLVDLLRGMDAWVRDLLRGSHRIAENYLAKCATIDRDVVVTTPDGQQVSGRAVAVARDGALVVDLGDRQVAVSAGDVEHASLA